MITGAYTTIISYYNNVAELKSLKWYQLYKRHKIKKAMQDKINDLIEADVFDLACATNTFIRAYGADIKLDGVGMNDLWFECGFGPTTISYKPNKNEFEVIDNNVGITYTIYKDKPPTPKFIQDLWTPLSVKLKVFYVGKIGTVVNMFIDNLAVKDDGK